MTKLINLKVKENSKQLEKLLRDAEPYVKPRIQMVMTLRKGPFAGLTPIAKGSGASYSSILKWMELYEKGGIKALLQLRDKGHSRFIWTPAILNDIQNRLKNGPLMNYKNFHKAICKAHSIKVSLPTFYKLVRDRYGADLKKLKMSQFPTVKESMRKLKILYKHSLPRIKPRIKILMLLKEGKIEKVGDLAKLTGGSYIRIRACIELYKQGGLSRVQSSSAGPYRTKISDDVHDAIRTRMINKPEERLADLHRWVQKNYLPELSYVTLHTHIRKHVLGDVPEGKR